MGRQAPRERRAHLFAVIEKMTREGPQGETDAPAGRIAHLRSIASLSRASYYRWREPKLSARDDADLRDLIQRLALRGRHEGYRRITRRLRDEEASSSTPSACSGSCGAVQYASSEYAARLDGRGFQRSMSRPGNPYDNAKAESCMKTLKAEEADGTAYADLEDARARIGAFIEDVYRRPPPLRPRL